MSVEPRFSVSVRELVEFACRTGDLGGSGNFTGTSRALEGTRGHQRVQKARPEGYEPEVSLAQVLAGDGFTLEIKGRVDGLWRGEGAPWLEEIKTIAGNWDGQADPLHWAQGKIYAAILTAQQPFPQLEVRLTYLELDSGHITTLRESFSAEQLSEFFHRVTAEYLEWLGAQLHWRQARDESIRNTSFPFGEYRAGQRQLAVATYRTLVRGGRMFAEAPTGIGKTISVLFPAVKAMGEGHFTHLFYLTAKTSGRAIAEKALADLRAGGLRCRSVTLTAKDKICFGDKQPCDMAECPFARGYYDRVKPALRELLGRESLRREVVEEVARRHEVCPFELSLDAARWCDVIVCDYNYVFDPAVNLKRFFEDGPGDYAFLVDEAHNLVDRGREMFSAELRSDQLDNVREAITAALPECARALGKISSLIKRLAAEAPVRDELPDELTPLIGKFLETAEQWLAQNQPTPFRDGLLEIYFALHRFSRTAAGFDENYVMITEAERSVELPLRALETRAATHGAGTPRSADWRARLFCLDPSKQLAEGLARGRAAVLFSGTLSPLEYFRRLLGGAAGDAVLQLPSPFPPENLCVLVEQHLRTDFKSREGSVDEVAAAIAAFIGARAGNYLVFFPSYRYLEATRPLVEPRLSNATVLAQRGDMTDADRAQFLAEFNVAHEQTLAGFAVMGGVFGEGIDLAGEKLIGAIVVGVGLPQVCLERDLIRRHFDERGESGFDFAYRFPGLNRVVQAAGRVIRSDTDRGAVLLIDARFQEPAYAQSLPRHWQRSAVRGAAEIARSALEFWAGGPPKQIDSAPARGHESVAHENLPHP